MQAFYKFDENTGSTTADSMGTTANNGTFQGTGTFWATGKINSGCNLMSFGGNSWVRTGNTNVGNVAGNNLTVAGWANINSGSNPFKPLIGKYYAGSGNGTFGLDCGSPGGSINFSVWVNGVQRTATTPSTPAITGTWLYLTGTYDGTTISLYTNAVLSATASWSGTLESSTNTMMFGMDDSLGANEPIAVIDEWGVWNRVLSGSEITQMYNSGSGKQLP